MKILITGGSGFIGSAVIRHIIHNTKDEVVNVDKLTYASTSTHESLTAVKNSTRYTFEYADICDNKAMQKIFFSHKPNAVMHLAAESHVDKSIANPLAFIQTNIIGTYILLEVTNKYWKSLKKKEKKHFRFLHVSTDEVFGDLKNPDRKLYGNTSSLFTEKTAYSPNNPYSASKASSDHLARSWLHTYGLPVIITHSSNNYGPFQFPEKIIPLIIVNALDNKSLPIYGKGDHIRDWVYVDDNARALYTVIKSGKIGETYNIGGRNEKKNIDVVRSICDLLDNLVPKKTSYYNQVIYVADRPGHDRRYAMDINKIYTELGWKPIENFKSGIRKTVEWYLSNQKWIEKTKLVFNKN